MKFQEILRLGRDQLPIRDGKTIAFLSRWIIKIGIKINNIPPYFH